MTWETISVKEMQQMGVSKPVFLKSDNGAERHRFFVDVNAGSAVVEVSHCPHDIHLNAPRRVAWLPLSVGELNTSFATENVGATAVRLPSVFCDRPQRQPQQ